MKRIMNFELRIMRGARPSRECRPTLDRLSTQKESKNTTKTPLIASLIREPSVRHQCVITEPHGRVAERLPNGHRRVFILSYKYLPVNEVGQDLIASCVPTATICPPA